MAKREVPEGMKRCAGAPGLGFPAHDAPLADFGPNQSSKDGLYHQCRTHAKVYQAHWRAKHAAEVAAADEAAGVVKQTRRRVTKAMIEAPMPTADLEQMLEQVGAGTPEGQALLESEAAKVAAVQKASRRASTKKVKNVPDEQESPVTPEDVAVA